MTEMHVVHDSFDAALRLPSIVVARQLGVEALILPSTAAAQSGSARPTLIHAQVSRTRIAISVSIASLLADSGHSGSGSISKSIRCPSAVATTVV